MARRTTFRLALTSWETGRVESGFGVKAGGLGAVLEELPEALIQAGEKFNLDVKVEVLTPCFAHYDRKGLKRRAFKIPAVLDGVPLEYQVYSRKFSENLSLVYFWDDWQLSWTNARSIYPSDPVFAFRFYAGVCQAMAGYIRKVGFDTVHGHDYHVGLVPFYLGESFLRRVPYHFTIHNASYQGVCPTEGRGYEVLDRVNLPGAELFHKYFDFYDNLNTLKAVMIRTHETGGKVTTVSGDLQGSWGYAAELKESYSDLMRRAQALKPWAPTGDVFVSNRHLPEFEHIPIIGITNGLNESNWPQHMAELKASYLKEIQAKLPFGSTLFNDPKVQEEMLGRDHNYDVDHLEVKARLKRLLHLEAFGSEPDPSALIFTVVGRLVEQKNLGLVADVMERCFQEDPGTRFVILASAPEGDQVGRQTEERFRRLAERYPNRCYFTGGFNQPLSRLILAGGDFTMIPSRFEPCGLVDYEACLLGTLVIGHRTGGLAKVAHCGYLYDWLDLSDRAGEAEAFHAQIRKAVQVYRHDPDEHLRMVRTAMTIDAGWAHSAELYIRLYRYGLLLREWQAGRAELLRTVEKYGRSLVKQEPLFREFFLPLEGDLLDLRMEEFLKQSLPPRVGRRSGD